VRKISSIRDGNSEDFESKIKELAEAINSDKKGMLAEYVVRRKEILELLDAALSYTDPDKGRYEKEEVVHDLIIPLRSDGEELDYEDHNLWILDDRLAFYSFLRSDRPFSAFLEGVDSTKEPDFTAIFDPAFAFDREGTNEPIIIVEFKRPGRNDYGPADNPVNQVLQYVDLFRSSSGFKDRTGKIRKSIPETTRFICFVIADFTPRLLESLRVTIASNKTADGEGYFGYSQAHNAFVEVLPYSKLVHDAKIRNEAFFSKLGLM
jgi:hypothetical protein